MQNKSIYTLFFISLLIFISSCKDVVLEEEVNNYCSCIDAHKEIPEDRWKCIKIMEDLQKKYSNQPRKLNAIVALTDVCW